MSVDTLLGRLGKIRKTGRDQYIACCPAHDDRSPSLSIKDCSDGRVLLNCFAGCEVEDILTAIGLGFADIMPERVGNEHYYKPIDRRYDPTQVFQGISHEAMVLYLFADKYQQLVEKSDSDRLGLSVVRLSAAIRAIPSPRVPDEIRAIRRAA